MAERERAVLVGVATGKVAKPTVEAHLDELAQLVDTAGGEAVARMVQERKSPDPTFFIGKGKVAELASLAKVNGAKLVLFDDDLTPSQVRHLEEELPDGVKVLDRSGVILDIFALRARTREAQTQVELAQLSYLLSRLTRRWSHLSRQAGGIGTRGWARHSWKATAASSAAGSRLCGSAWTTSRGSALCSASGVPSSRRWRWWATPMLARARFSRASQGHERWWRIACSRRSTHGRAGPRSAMAW